jgi:hypothetical protein
MGNARSSPMKRESVYVICMGGLWKMTPSSYRRFLKTVAGEKEWDLDNFGKMVAPWVKNITDITPDSARSELEES